jgi:hypothetical protein
MEDPGAHTFELVVELLGYVLAHDGLRTTGQRRELRVSM